MKYYIDTEFSERPCTIELISVAIVAENGREFYAEVENFDLSLANEWVKENVITQLWSRQSDKRKFNVWSRDGGSGGLMPKRNIGSAIRRFIGDDEPEFWGYYADYDWVAFCWLFGAMIDLPKGWPMYCRDLKQLADQIQCDPFPQPNGEHNALVDARWNRQFHRYLMGTDSTRDEEGNENE